MPPTTRQKSASRGIVKNPARRPRAPIQRKASSTNSDAWNFLNTNDEGEEEVRESVEADDDGHTATNAMADADDPIDFLRDNVDRVGMEVERFAEALDRFYKELPHAQDKVGAAIDMVKQLKGIALGAVNALEKGHRRERMELLRKEWSQKAALSQQDGAESTVQANSLRPTKAEKVKELRRWQQEADVWDLFGLILEIHYNHPVRKREVEEKLAKMQPPHRYTTQKELWERFLLENGLAMERYRVRQWLEQAADHQDSDLPAIVAELEARSGAGKGLWNRGWMATRAQIKGEKRKRSWAKAFDATQTQVRSSTSNDILVTTLDPDAPSRENRALEKPDAFHERAVWIACWEMLRRGKPWTEIVQWCEEHNEGWRANVLAPATDTTDAVSSAAWRKMCYLASTSGCSNDYEAAVYGLLGGNFNVVQKVCRSTHDHLFAYYSCLLARHFDVYLQKNYPDRVSAMPLRNLDFEEEMTDSDKAKTAVATLIFQLKDKLSKSSDGIDSPLRMIEHYLLTNEAESMAFTVGRAVTDLVESDKSQHDPSLTRNLAETAIVEDDQSMRIVATMYSILTALNIEPASPEDLLIEENVLAGYIRILRALGLRHLVFTYACRMQSAAGNFAVALTLQDVITASEQREMLTLISGCGMSAPDILKELLRHTMGTTLDAKRYSKQPFRVLEKCATGNLHPGQRIKFDFLDDTMTEEDFGIVRCLQWFQLVPGLWRQTFNAIAAVLHGCLMTGRLACALEIARVVSCESISMQKTHDLIGRTINVFDKNSAPENEESQQYLEWEVLRRQARTAHELEQVVRAVEALADWVQVERPFTSEPRKSTTVPQDLKEAKSALDEAMQPLLSGILLQAEDETQKGQLDQVRVRFLPEIILAYNSALYTAGPTISRDAYMDSMDLSVAVADEENGLAECFIKSGRMGELVTMFAQVSKMMLIMKATGTRRKMGKNGKDLGMWEIGPQGVGAAAAGIEGSVDTFALS